MAERADMGPTEREIAELLRQASALASEHFSVFAMRSAAERPIGTALSAEQRVEAQDELRLEALEGAVSRLARAIDRLLAGAD